MSDQQSRIALQLQSIRAPDTERSGESGMLSARSDEQSIEFEINLPGTMLND